MRSLDKAIIIGLAVIIIVGMLVSYMPHPYNAQFSAWEDDDGVHYEFSANYSMETHAVAIASDLDYDIDYIAVYYDESYAAINSWELQEIMLDDLRIHLEIRSFNGFGYYDSDELLDFLDTADKSSVAVLFASGAISDKLYDGTSESPIVEWLRSGGTVINIAGCLGKYVSHGPDQSDIETVSGYASLFTGSDLMDDSDFNDNRSSLRATECVNQTMSDALLINITEYSYGIRCDGLENYLSLGYRSSSGYESAVIYASGEGMVMNFGITVEYQVHTLHYVAQVIAAGLDYTSRIVDHDIGDTSSDPTGVLGPSDEIDHVYGFIGYTRATYGLKVMI